MLWQSYKYVNTTEKKIYKFLEEKFPLESFFTELSQQGLKFTLISSSH